jgi:hypothetical protein
LVAAVHGSFERWGSGPDDGEPSSGGPAAGSSASASTTSRVVAATVIAVLLAGSLYGCRAAVLSGSGVRPLVRAEADDGPAPSGDDAPAASTGDEQTGDGASADGADGGVDVESVELASAAASRRFPSVAAVVQCSPSHRLPDDPLRHPNHAGASHDHTFFGSVAAAADATVRELRVAATTCDDPDDRSSYWLPTPIGASWTSLRAYYDRGTVAADAIVTPPDGLLMVSDAARWSCRRDREQSGWSETMPPCDGGVRLRLSFAQCWNGRDVRPPGHLAEARNGRCPPSHPVAIPRVELVAELDRRPTALSSGALREPGAVHGDAWVVWDRERLEFVVGRCIRGERSSNTELKECARLRRGGRLQ